MVTQSIAEQAVQCGYCFNGQIIKGAELLFKTPQPTEAQIRSAMNGHICRKRNISHKRWLGVLEAATAAAKWTPRVAASKLSTARIVTGRGIGLGTHHLPQNQGSRITYAAAVVDIEVNRDNGLVTAKHVYGAMDAGLVINPGIVENQIVGMSVHGASLALREEVQFNQTNVTSLDWNWYQTLRFGEHPAVTPIVVQQIHTSDRIASCRAILPGT